MCPQMLNSKLILIRILLCETENKKMKKPSKIKIEKNYARALFDAAISADMLERVQKDMAFLCEIKSIEEIGSPLIEKEKQIELIDMLGKKSDISLTTIRFLKLLLENNEMKRLDDIKAQFDDMVLSHNGIQKIVVETAQKLTTRQEEKLIRGLKRKLKKDVALTYVLNENLLGGLILRMGSKEINDSLKNKLEIFENIMKGVN